MSKKTTINVITAVTDPILGTTYKSEPVTIPQSVVHAKKQFETVIAKKTYKTRSEHTKKK